MLLRNCRKFLRNDVKKNCHQCCRQNIESAEHAVRSRIWSEFSFRSFAWLRGTRNMAAPVQKFDYFLVLDFEATCNKDVKPVPQEIIEFPVLKVNSKTFLIDDRFHQYVQPDVHKELTPFCTELTGIIQDQVDGQPNLQTTLQLFDDWMKSQGLLDPNVSSVFVTCGDWDLKTMLPTQCQYFNLKVPSYFDQWINIKKPYCDVTGTYPKGMMQMLQGLNLKHQGRHHSGIDDCLNIARILKGIGDKGYIFKATGSVHQA